LFRQIWKKAMTCIEWDCRLAWFSLGKPLLSGIRRSAPARHMEQMVSALSEPGNPYLTRHQPGPCTKPAGKPAANDGGNKLAGISPRSAASPLPVLPRRALGRLAAIFGCWARSIKEFL